MTITARAVHARELELTTSRGRVYAPTSLDVDRGQVTALLGPARSGRTALLLTLAGRMRPTAGSASVFGHDVVREGRRVRTLVGLGLVPGVNDLDDSLTAGQHLAERALLCRRQRTPDPRALLERVGLAGASGTRVGELDTDSCVRLGIALALTGAPKLLALDDLDHDLEPAEQAAIVALLREAADDGIAVFFTCVDERTAALAEVTIALPACHHLSNKEAIRALA